MKKILYLLIISIIFTGCSFNIDTMENITIYTSTYPIEFITTRLYGENSTVLSIYPNEVIALSDKLLSDYSKGDLFVYTGLSKERNYAVKMLNNNRRLKIVDATMGMEYKSTIEELWINPSNFLMLCLNIKNGMKEYISSSYLRKQIDDNYEELKIKVSEIDAEIKLTVENADKEYLLVSNDLFKFLEKYRLNVISLEDNENLTNRRLNDAKEIIKKHNIKHIITLETDVLNEDVEQLLEEMEIEKLYFHPLTTISTEEKANGEDYISLSYKNINILKKELYN